MNLLRGAKGTSGSPWLCLLLGALLAGRFGLLTDEASALRGAAITPQASTTRGEVPLDRIRDASRRIAGHFPTFEATDWSKAHPEEVAQSLEGYLASNPNRPGERRATLYLQPIGDLTSTQRRVLKATRDLLGRWFGMPVKVLSTVESRSIPDRAKRIHPQWKDRQLLAGYLLGEVIRPRVPEDAVAVLGLTATDLWPGQGWNFVFGQASLRERIGVWSLYRYGDPERSDADFHLYLLRALKVATHETGHMIGMTHCVSFQCGMNGSNHLPEADAAPLAFCPECSAKLWWATRADPVSWLRSVEEFCTHLGLKEETGIWAKCLRSLER